MNLRDLNRLLEKVNQNSGRSFTLNDLLSVASQINEQTLSDERKLRSLIKNLGAAVGKTLSDRDVDRIIGLIRQNRDALTDPKRAERLFKKY